MSSMPRKLPLNVVRETRAGRTRLYYRVGKGPRIRLPDDVASKAFREAYAAALAGGPPRPAGRDGPVHGLKWLVARYMESASWSSLAAGTRGARGNIFRRVIEDAQNPDYRDIDTAAMRHAMERRKNTPAQAAALLKALRGLFRWAVVNGHVEHDPTAGVSAPRCRSDGFAPWTMDDWRRFCARWPAGTMPRKAAELMLYTGLRRSDLVRIGRQHVKDGVLTIRTVKTGAIVSAELPVHLVAMLADTENLHFVTGAHGGPFTPESFGNWFRDRCNEAGLPDRSAHGIRKLSATLAANAGATTHELMAQYGWSTTTQAETYTRGADRAALGLKASRRLADQIANEVSPQTNPPAGKITKKPTKSKAI
jgi:integrase